MHQHGLGTRSFGQPPSHQRFPGHLRRIFDARQRVPFACQAQYGECCDHGKRSEDNRLFLPVLEAALKDEEAVSELFEEHDTVEVMTHPAYIDKELLTNSSYTYPRVDELEFLTDPDVVIRLNKLTDVQLVSFRNLT